MPTLKITGISSVDVHVLDAGPREKACLKSLACLSPGEIFHRSADFDPIASPQESASENKAGLTTMLSTKPPEWVETIRCLWIFNIFLHSRGKEKLISNLRHYCSHYVWRCKHCQMYNCVLITQLSYPKWRG